ncbi:MAG TPA: class I SAM-dependent methyltransferase [Pyrinomonadaceae bacterium]|jgi:tocopherol O-methyltransferase
MQYNLTERIQEHYDIASLYYEKLWGKHLHHGYYHTGRESKEEAAENLIKFLVEQAEIREGARVLDVGCGIGGASMWLAEQLNCKVTGITISASQVRMATEAARHLLNKPTFLLDDANRLSVTGDFDVVWAVEVISHLNNRGEFFRRMSRLLVSGGRFCEAAWLKEEGLNRKAEDKYIRPIEAGMLVSLPTLSEYRRHIEDNELRLLYYEDISAKVAKTWDICLEIARDRAVWGFAAQHGQEFIAFLKSFKAMRNGFRSGTFRYGVLVVEKP